MTNATLNNTVTEPEKLVMFIRDGLIEQEHFGYIVKADKDRVIEKMGEDRNYPFFLRSCEKPLQATLMIDYELDKEFDMTDEEIAICCASHAGEKVHVNLVRNLLQKFGVSEDKLKCGIQEPISKTARDELLKNGESALAIHNNCSGKHAMMLGLCKLNGWDLDTYDSPNHPLQEEILNKVYELCSITHEYPITKDGCGVPVVAMPLANMVKGYLNVFCNPEYEKIKNAFLNHPYIIGGEDRTDTKIMQHTENVIAKVGAGGLCIVINTELEEGFVVKVCDSNMGAREDITIDLINNLHWGSIEHPHEIRTIHGDIVGEIKTVV